jgi:hypothetical protein
MSRTAESRETPGTKPTTVRFTKADTELIKKLQVRVGESRMALIRMGLKELARRYDVDPS